MVSLCYLVFLGRKKSPVMGLGMNDEQFVRIIYVAVLSALVYGYLWPAIKEAYSKWVENGCKTPNFFRRKRG